MRSTDNDISMPAATGAAILKYAKGTTADIITEVMDCYNDTVMQTTEAAKYLTGATDLDSAMNAAKFCDDFVKYKIDPNGVQWVKTPARLFKDGKGDCKSYSILINSCLANMGIPHLFRFVSYDNSDEYSHVYPVAIIDGEECPLDVVAWQLRRIQFGKELQYKRKKDMAGTTRISRLCGIGDAEAEQYTVHSSEYNTGKVAQNYLESLIDLEQARANATTDPDKLESIYNKLDFYEVCLAATTLTDDDEILRRVAMLLAQYGEAGEFNKSYDSLADRAAALQNTIHKLNADFATLIRDGYDFQQEFIARNREFFDWWDKEVVAHNYVVESISGIGADQTKAVIQSIGPGIMYATQPQKLDTAKAALKQSRHNKVVQYINAKHPELSPATIVNELRAGTLNTFSMDPETVINVLKTGKAVGVAGIGEGYTVEDIANSMTPDYAAKFGTGVSASTAATANQTLTTAAAKVGSSDVGRDWADYLTMTADALKTVGGTIVDIMGQVNTLTGADTLQKMNTAGLTGIVPNVDDWTSSKWIKYAGYAALGIGAWCLLKPSKKKRRR